MGWVVGVVRRVGGEGCVEAHIFYFSFLCFGLWEVRMGNAIIVWIGIEDWGAGMGESLYNR